MEVYHCSGLVKGALCTVIAIRVHTITVKFDRMSQTYPVVRVKARFVVMKNIPTTMDAGDYDITAGTTAPKDSDAAGPSPHSEGNGKQCSSYS